MDEFIQYLRERVEPNIARAVQNRAELITTETRVQVG
ncbi:hypothetical protein GXY_08350 [Novacetimonas hansenii ATCC 23769]|uniref:Uncharacterized protein n=1 Tax=Novacetimonas hansenii ATCC 23769 TaxID=714995 RepID=D5QEV5_NOVHA|nr:hypothetical protein GXY_08350 [Novacetimonas hansenii ATCC 23769]